MCILQLYQLLDKHEKLPLDFKCIQDKLIAQTKGYPVLADVHKALSEKSCDSYKDLFYFTWETLMDDRNQVSFKYIDCATSLFATLLDTDFDTVAEYLYEDDYYTDINNCKARIIYEFEQYKKLVVSLDFDDTIFDFHKTGRKYTKLVRVLKSISAYTYIIVNTSRNEKDYDFIRDYMSSIGLRVDKINEPADFMPIKGGKIYANVYVDDRGGLPSTYQMLCHLEGYLNKNNYI